MAKRIMTFGEVQKRLRAQRAKVREEDRSKDNVAADRRAMIEKVIESGVATEAKAKRWSTAKLAKELESADAPSDKVAGDEE